MTRVLIRLSLKVNACGIIVSEDIWESVWVTIIISFHKFLYVLMIDNGCTIYNRIL